MAQPLVVGLPPNLEFTSGYLIRVTALDPTTGATVSGVTVSDVTFQVGDEGGAIGEGLPNILLLRET